MVVEVGTVDTAVLTGVFGLGGVIVGGIVTAFSERESETRRTIDSGVASARLVHLELYDLKTRLIDAAEDEGDWQWVPEPPLTPVLDEHAGRLAPLLSTDEWSAVATLYAQCRFNAPLLQAKRKLAIMMFEDLPETDPRWATCTHIEPEDKEIVGRVTTRIGPALEALAPLINGERMTRTQRVMRWLRLSPQTLGE